MKRVVTSRMEVNLSYLLRCVYFISLLRLRQSGKKKKKITLHMKRPGGRKDDMKLALLKLKTIVQRDQTDGASPLPRHRFEDSESDKGSLGPAEGMDS